MQKEFLTSDERELVFQSKEINSCHVDVTQKVMDRIRIHKQNPSSRGSRKVMTGVLFGLLLAGSTGFIGYASGFFQLTNHKGEVELRAEHQSEMTYTNVQPVMNANEAQVESIYKNVLEALEPGNIAIVYINDPLLNPMKTTAWLTKPLEILSLPSFTENITKEHVPAFKKPTALPDGYTFAKGVIVKDFDTYSNMGKFEDELKQKAASSKEKVVTKVGKWFKDDIASVTYEYRNGSSIIRAGVAFTGSKYMTVPDDTRVEEVKGKSGTSYLYMEGTERTIKWIEGEEMNRRAYSITVSKESSLTKEDMVSFAESMK